MWFTGLDEPRGVGYNRHRSFGDCEFLRCPEESKIDDSRQESLAAERNQGIVRRSILIANSNAQCGTQLNQPSKRISVASDSERTVYLPRAREWTSLQQCS